MAESMMSIKSKLDMATGLLMDVLDAIDGPDSEELRDDLLELLAPLAERLIHAEMKETGGVASRGEIA